MDRHRAASGAGTRLLVSGSNPEAFAEPVRTRFPQLDIACCETYGEIAGLAARHRPQVVLTSRDLFGPYPNEVIFEIPELKWLAVSGAGIDYLEPWDPETVTVTNHSGLAADPMAQYAIGATIAHFHHLPTYVRQQSARIWRRHLVEPIRGKTMAVIGLGRIGQAVADKAAALGMRVIGVRSRPRPMVGIERVVGADELHAVLNEADVVVITVPLTAETRRLFDADTLAAMKAGAFLINLSRGAVIDEPALLHALREGPLGGAALDVFDEEPLPPESPFWGMETVIVTPHSISDFPGWEQAAGEMFADNMANWLAGRPLFNVVDPVRGY